MGAILFSIGDSRLKQKQNQKKIGRDNRERKNSGNERATQRRMD